MSVEALTHLSDTKLLSQLKTLVRRERETTLDVLKHLAEVDRRRLYLLLGYGTLFAYCTQRLKYSSSAAGRRIAAARCIRRFPEVAGLLERGEANLSTVSAVASILTDDNKSELVGQIRGKSYNEVETVVASYKPRALLRDRVKPVCLRVRAQRPTGQTQQHRTSMPAHSRSGVGITKNQRNLPCQPTRRPGRRSRRCTSSGRYSLCSCNHWTYAHIAEMSSGSRCFS